MGREIKLFATGRDVFSFAQRDGTVHIIFHDGTGRCYIYSRRDGTAPSFFDEKGHAVVHLDMACCTQLKRAMQICAVSSAEPEAGSHHCER